MATISQILEHDLIARQAQIDARRRDLARPAPTVDELPGYECPVWVEAPVFGSAGGRSGIGALQPMGDGAAKGL